MNNLQTIINQRIKFLRVSLKINQTEFAESLGVTPSTISGLEGNKASASLGLLEKIAQTYEKEYKYFIEEEPSKTAISKDNNGNLVQNSNNVNIDTCKQEIVSLKEQVRLQNEIIDLLKKNQK